MSVITYTASARATLMAGHTAGVIYSFEIGFMAYEQSLNSPKTQHRSLDGTTESILQRIDKTVNVTIGLYDSTDEPQIEEFIQSVGGGEAFSVDVYGTIAVPDTLTNLKINGDSHKPARLGPRTFSLAFNAFIV